MAPFVGYDKIVIFIYIIIIYQNSKKVYVNLDKRNEERVNKIFLHCFND